MFKLLKRIFLQRPPTLVFTRKSDADLLQDLESNIAAYNNLRTYKGPGMQFSIAMLAVKIETIKDDLGIKKELI